MPDKEAGAGSDPIDRFTRIYRSAFAGVLAYALRRVPDRQEAFDIVAETFAITWRRLDSVPQGPQETAWVYGVARRVVANASRTRQRRARLQDRLQAAEGPGPGAESGNPLTVMGGAAASDDERVQTVLAALDRLPPRHREVLRLAAWEDLTHAQIGEVLGCSANAVAIRLHRARRALHDAFALERARQSRLDRPVSFTFAPDHPESGGRR